MQYLARILKVHGALESSIELEAKLGALCQDHGRLGNGIGRFAASAGSGISEHARARPAESMGEPLALPFHGLDNIDRNFSMVFGVDGVPGTGQRANTHSGVLGSAITYKYASTKFRQMHLIARIAPVSDHGVYALVPCRSEELEIASTWAHLHSRSLVPCSPECVETLGVNLVYGVRRKGSRDGFNNGPKAAMGGFILTVVPPLPPTCRRPNFRSVNHRLVRRSTSVIALPSTLVYSRMLIAPVTLGRSANASTASRHAIRKSKP